MNLVRTLLAAAAFAAALPAALTPAGATTPLPVRTLNSSESSAISGLPYLSPGSHPFSMVAMSKSLAYNRPVLGPAVQRSNGGIASVYRGAPHTSVPAAPPMPPSSALFDMAQDGDTAQGWGAMSASGVPYIKATGYGDFSTDVTASWNTTVTIPSGAAGREVVVRFVIPPVSVAGNTEQQGQARWRARLRAELLVNGFPAWSTEALRLTTDPSKSSSGSEVLVLQQFGTELPFPTNDEDTPYSSGGLNNDTTNATVNSPSTKKVVYLTLGRFQQGAVLALSMIHRANAMTVPGVAGGSDHRCKWKSQEDRYFCSRASVSVNGDEGEAPRIYLVP